MTDSQDFSGLFSFTKPVTMTFPNLTTARAFKGKSGKDQGEPKFDGNFETALDNPELTAAKQLAIAIAKAKWPGREIKVWNPTPGFVNDRDALMFPFHKGDALADAGNGKREWSRGKGVIVARSKFRPGLAVVLNGRIADINKNDDKEVAANQNYFYSGVSVLAQFNFVAYDGVGNNPDGVTAYLQHILSFNTGERLTGGGRSGADVFGGYVGIVSDEDPTARKDSVADLL